MRNYADITKEELINAMGGKVPQRETDFMRLCAPSQLRIGDMLDLLKEDYPAYMAEFPIYHTIHKFLLSSDICHKSYIMLRELLDKAKATNRDKHDLLSQTQELSFRVIGRDIYKREIEIVDGHDGSSYFWIMPVRVVDYANTDNMDSVARMKSNEISIDEDDVEQYLFPFLYKYFDEELEANAQRADANGFELNLVHNFFTFEAIEYILEDIRDTIDALSTGRDNEYTGELSKR